MSPPTRKTLNVKALLWILVPTVLLFGGVHVLHGYQVRRSAKGLFRRAERAEKDRDVRKAAEYLERYLAFAHNDTVALEKFGSLLASGSLGTSTGTRERAVAVFERLLIQDTGRQDIRRRLVDLKIDLGQYDECRDDLRILLKATPDDGTLEFLLGRCEEEAGQFAEAARWYDQARRHAKDQIQAHVRLADLLRRRLNSSGKADEVMDARQVKEGVIAANPDSFGAYLARRAYRKAFLLPGADEDVARALALAPDEADVLLAAAEVSTDAGRLDEAAGHLDRGLDRYPNDPRMYQRRAHLEISTGHPDKALDCLRRAVKAVPDNRDLKFNLAELMVQRGDASEVVPVIEELRKGGFPPEALDFLDASILVNQRRWVEAARALERVRPQLSVRGMPALAKRACMELGACYERLENHDLRYNTYREAVAIHLADDPLRVPAHLGLAASLAALGKIDEAVTEYRGIIGLPDAPPGVEVTLARLLILENLRLPERRRQWPEVEQLLDQSEKKQPDSKEVAILRAERMVAGGQIDHARQLLKKACDRHPDQVELWVILASVIERQGEPEAALPVLAEAERRLGDRVELRLARARYWGNRGGPKAIETLRKLLDGADRFAGDDRYGLLSGLADAFDRAGDAKAATELRARLASEQPDDLRIRLVLCDAALANDDEAALERVLGEVRRIEGEDGCLWRYGEALLRMRRGQRGDGAAMVEARSLLAAAAVKRPSWSRLSLAEAQIDDLQKHPDEALKNYLHAINLGDRSPRAFRRALELLYAGRRYAEADELLRKLQEQMPISGDLQRLAADISLQTQDFDRALSLARQAVSINSDDYHDHIWLGQVLWAVSRRAEEEGRREEATRLQREAGEAFRRAVKIAGEVPESWLALVQFLAAGNQTKEAEAVVAEAERVLSKKDAPLALGQCYEWIGKQDKARDYYAEALKARPDETGTLQSVAGYDLRRGDVRAAEPLLRRLIDQGSRSPDEAARARRILAIVLASGGSRSGSLEALKLLGLSNDTGAATPTGEVSVEELRTRASVLGLQPGRARRRDAIRLLEEVVRREKPPRPADLFLMAQLAEADGDWPRARDQMLGLLAAAPRNPDYLAHYVQSLVRRGQFEEAKARLNTLEQLQPQSPRSVELRAKVLHGEGKDAEAVTLMKGLAKERPTLLVPAAALLEELNQAVAAEQLYREAVSAKGPPETALLLAGFLARHDRLSEALDLCQSAWATCPALTVADACVSAVYATSTANPAQCRRVDRWLEEAVAKQPEAIPLEFCLANLRIFEEKYDDAEAIFRRVAERKPDSSSPLNNLAWLLALRGERPKEAVALAEKAIAMDGPLPHLLDTRALSYLSAGETSPAIKDLEEAIAEAPTAELYLHLSEAHRLANNPSAASDALRRAQSLGLQLQKLQPLERVAYRRFTGRDSLPGN